MPPRFTHLTRLNIRKLPSGERISEHGITAKRLRSGDTRYSVNVMVDGQRIHRVIGRESEGTTRSQCEQFIEARRTEAREGRLSLPRNRKTPLVFKQAASQYLQRLVEASGKNIPTKQRHLTQRLSPYFGCQRLDTISVFTVEKYKKCRMDGGAQPGTVNRELATLSHLFGCALEWKWLRERPCRFKLLPENPGRIVVLTDEQSDALLRAAIADEDPECWLFVMFGLNTAMRHSEIIRARFDQVDFSRHRLFIPQAKAGSRTQPITTELVETLEHERYMREDREGWIFPSPRPTASNRGHRNRMRDPFRRSVIRAGLDPDVITPHVMRHTAITKLVQAGVDLPTIQMISGHKTVAMVLKYTHIHGTHVDAAINAIGHPLPPGTQRPVEPIKTKTGTGRVQIADIITPELHAPKRKGLGR